MSDKKYSPDSSEAFLRDVQLHGELPIQEKHIKTLAKVMEEKMITGTQARLDFVRAHVAQHPEIGTQQSNSAPKLTLSQLRQMSPTQKLDHVYKVPAPTLNGLKLDK